MALETSSMAQRPYLRPASTLAGMIWPQRVPRMRWYSALLSWAATALRAGPMPLSAAAALARLSPFSMAISA